MQTLIALFRGINVGRTRSLPMKDLKRILEDLGYQDIRTYIQSGNVVMRDGELADGQIGQLVRFQETL